MEKSVQNPEEYTFLIHTVSFFTRRDAVAALHERWSHKTKTWFNRNLDWLVEIDPFQLGEIIGHSDPTANEAIRKVMQGVAA